MKRCRDTNDGSKGSGVEEATFGHSVKQMRSPRRSMEISDTAVNGAMMALLLDAEVNWGL
jgi:hypothetical protein